MIDANILVIDDTKSVLSALEILLQFEYKSVQTISNPNLLSSFPNLKEIDIILLDMNFSARKYHRRKNVRQAARVL